jgi:hypothetical protein
MFMYKIKIAGAVVASSAAQWLNTQNYPYNLELESGSLSPVYIFGFMHESAASHFALKWS